MLPKSNLSKEGKQLRFRSKLIGFGAVLALATLVLSPNANAVTKKERILWSQSFNEKAGTKVDPKTWTYDLGNGFGWGNNEAANISTDGKGSLVITAKKLNPDEPRDQYITNYCANCLYSSAKVVTRGKVGFKYGSMSARMQIPEGVGMWPAFWMLGVPRSNCNGWPSCGEIDIMEARGADVYHSVSSLHGPGYSGGSALSHYYFSGNDPLSTGYHIYRLDWLQNSVKFYVDGHLVGSETKNTVKPNDWAFNGEFYLILNLATGGNFDGGDLDESIQQAQLKIDWIRYSTLNGVGTLYKH
ncbi:MAG: glycoside hydrolase family 16 protein [Micrococcales bacterium]|nr:glycoside hydrolase family 16 protein [Micrococcales bacterium]